jgi:hypothetical protein
VPAINWETLQQTTPPPCQPFGKMTWQEDVVREEQERAKEKQAEIRAKWYASKRWTVDWVAWRVLGVIW